MVVSRVFVSGLVLATISLLSPPAHAQVTTATLYGVVHDSTGAILPGANVVLTHEGTNLIRETVSDEDIAPASFAYQQALAAGPGTYIDFAGAEAARAIATAPPSEAFVK